ncbi:hypothetical protein [Parasphingopyxis sp.]|uniref:hypothetical protein n=1 Tax=Parasphingopyxis sp. TaxID=1920299 RepID=UPI002613F37E|nr:hypothetical protein [Parasphingopyxis sp.]
MATITAVQRVFAGFALYAALLAMPAYGQMAAPLPTSVEIAVGEGGFTFDDWAGQAIPVWTFRSSRAGADAPVVFVMHGAGRGPQRYLSAWTETAEREGYVMIAPEFSRDAFPGSRSYNLGNREDADGLPVPEERWSFSVIEPLFDTIVSSLGGQQSGYYLYGHSAGSQFVHRFLAFKPDARVIRTLAANAGWYTMPDFSEAFPYGLSGSGVTEEALHSMLSRDVVVLLGDLDIDTDHDQLRRTPEAMRQGSHRFSRGVSFVEQARRAAAERGIPFNWRTHVVIGAAHSNDLMSGAAAEFID